MADYRDYEAEERQERAQAERVLGRYNQLVGAGFSHEQAAALLGMFVPRRPGDVLRD